MSDFWDNVEFGVFATVWLVMGFLCFGALAGAGANVERNREAAKPTPRAVAVERECPAEFAALAKHGAKVICF